MTRVPHLDELVVTAATPADQVTGLLAWLRFRLDRALIVDGVALRRTRDGRLCLAWPERRDRAGRQHPILRPVDDAARVAIEREVFAQLGLGAAP